MGDIVMHQRPVQSINSKCGVLDWRGGKHVAMNGRWACNYDCEDIRTMDEIEEPEEYNKLLKPLVVSVRPDIYRSVPNSKNVRSIDGFTMICKEGQRARIDKFDNLRLDGDMSVRDVGVCYDDPEDAGRPKKKMKLVETPASADGRGFTMLVLRVEPFAVGLGELGPVAERISHNLIQPTS